jgi:type I restriction enzyme S subunit
MALFVTESDWQEMRASIKGVGDRRQRIQPNQIPARQDWIPASQETRRIDSMFDQNLALRATRAAIGQTNAALLPATLERLLAGSA